MLSCHKILAPVTMLPCHKILAHVTMLPCHIIQQTCTCHCVILSQDTGELHLSLCYPVTMLSCHKILAPVTRYLHLSLCYPVTRYWHLSLCYHSKRWSRLAVSYVLFCHKTIQTLGGRSYQNPTCTIIQTVKSRTAIAYEPLALHHS